jgi:nitrite reductase (cytochrome c-552)
MSDTPNAPTSASPGTPPAGRRQWLIYAALILGAAVVTLVVAAVLVTIFEHKQQARTPFVRVVEIDEISTDPAPWGMNWPRHYDGYRATADHAGYGGSSAMSQSKLDVQPWLKRLYAGYAFSIDYREARGHAYMLHDQKVTERVTKRKQAGACLHCHASATVAYRKAGLEALGRPADEATLRKGFDMEAVIAGFVAVSRKPYHEVLALMEAAPDGTPDDDGAVGGAHPVSCIDCHDPATMKIRVTRPGFVRGIAALAAGDGAAPHLPSIANWRAGDRQKPYDPNADATRQEMRSFVCGQCHVEYYCGDKDTLTFPWGKGLRVEDEEAFWDEQRFPDDGAPFYDYVHGETGAKVYKAQHPEFELWSQGIHARSGVSCADCHMPYERAGAMKISSHDVASPMGRVNNACQTCHTVPEEELKTRVHEIQGRTVAMLERAAVAMTDMLDAVLEAKAAGATEAQLQPVFDLQRKAMWRLDYISSENSKGFHADQEAVRVLGESIDYSRQAQALALRFRAPAAPSTDGLPRQPIIGVTPTAAAPTSAPAVEAPAPAPAPAPANDAAAPADPATPRPAADADATP